MTPEQPKAWRQGRWGGGAGALGEETGVHPGKLTTLSLPNFILFSLKPFRSQRGSSRGQCPLPGCAADPRPREQRQCRATRSRTNGSGPRRGARERLRAARHLLRASFSTGVGDTAPAHTWFLL